MGRARFRTLLIADFFQYCQKHRQRDASGMKRRPAGHRAQRAVSLRCEQDPITGSAAAVRLRSPARQGTGGQNQRSLGPGPCIHQHREAPLGVRVLLSGAGEENLGEQASLSSVASATRSSRPLRRAASVILRRFSRIIAELRWKAGKRRLGLQLPQCLLYATPADRCF